MGVEPIPRQSQCLMLPLHHIHHIKIRLFVIVTTDTAGIEPANYHHVLYESSLPETEAEEVGFEPTFSN